MFQDSGHRPHARHTGQTPKNDIVDAPYHLKVTLDTWGPADNLFPTIYDSLQANWGERPSRTVENDDQDNTGEIWPHRVDHLQRRTGWLSLTDGQRAYVDSCFAGKTLPQILEMISFNFLIDGCTRAATHQIVRARMGMPGFMQHGGRDNDWRHRPWVMPETIRRACEAEMFEGHPDDAPLGERIHCIRDWSPIHEFIEVAHGDDKVSLQGAIQDYLMTGRQLYAALVDAGIPWEDARRLLWIGTSTYIHFVGNYRAVDSFLTQRLEHVMDWEINCVAQLMLREIKMKCPPIMSKYLGSTSDKQGKAAMAGLESWPPDMKYPNPFERCVCGHEKKEHNVTTATLEGKSIEMAITPCMGCMKEGHHCTAYVPKDTLPREHRPEQNPFWVLSPASMAGGPIQWIPTNGVYPHEVIHALQKSRTE